MSLLFAKTQPSYICSGIEYRVILKALFEIYIDSDVKRPADFTSEVIFAFSEN